MYTVYCICIMQLNQVMVANLLSYQTYGFYRSIKLCATFHLLRHPFTLDDGGLIPENALSSLGLRQIDPKLH